MSEPETNHTESRRLPDSEKPPAYVALKQKRRETSLAKPFFLAGLMLLAVALLAPLVRVLEPEETRALPVEDVEAVELGPPPTLPESMKFTEPEIVEIPELEEEQYLPITANTLETESAEVLEALAGRDAPASMARLLQESERVYGPDEVDRPASPQDQESLDSLAEALGSGRTSIVLKINPDGSVGGLQNADIEGDPEKQAALEQFLGKARFRPAIKDGVAVPSAYSIDLRR